MNGSNTSQNILDLMTSGNKATIKRMKDKRDIFAEVDPEKCIALPALRPVLETDVEAHEQTFKNQELIMKLIAELSATLSGSKDGLEWKSPFGRIAIHGTRTILIVGLVILLLDRMNVKLLPELNKESQRVEVKEVNK